MKKQMLFEALNEWRKIRAKKNRSADIRNLIAFLAIMALLIAALAGWSNSFYNESLGQGMYKWGQCRGTCEGHGFTAHDYEHYKYTPYLSCECITPDNELKLFVIPT